MSILVLSMMTCTLFGCKVSMPTFSALPSGASFLQTPLPTPTPTPGPRVIAVFGADSATDFIAGVTSAAEGTEIEVDVVEGGVRALSTYVPEGNAAAIVYLTKKSEAIPAANIPVFAFAATGQSVSGGIFYLGYDGADEAQLALKSAIEYPPHLTPVRMIGLFTSQTSAAYTVFSSAKSAGQVFAKMEFFEDSSEVTLTNWLNDAFLSYYPGMLDAVYAETGALAVAAADVLASLGRSDIEVFSAGTDADAQAKLSQILVCAVGANAREAGARCFVEAKKLLQGGQAQSGILLPEPIWYSPKPE